MEHGSHPPPHRLGHIQIAHRVPVNHGINDLITSFGFVVVSEDAVACLEDYAPRKVLNQWTFQARMYNLGHIQIAHRVPVKYVLANGQISRHGVAAGTLWHGLFPGGGQLSGGLSG